MKERKSRGSGQLSDCLKCSNWLTQHAQSNHHEWLDDSYTHVAVARDTCVWLRR